MSKRGPMPESVPFEQLIGQMTVEETIQEIDAEQGCGIGLDGRCACDALQESIDRRD